jgi:hypothetical protein
MVGDTTDDIQPDGLGLTLKGQERTNEGRLPGKKLYRIDKACHHASGTADRSGIAGEGGFASLYALADWRVSILLYSYWASVIRRFRQCVQYVPGKGY